MKLGWNLMWCILYYQITYLDQQSDGATLVHLQDLSVLGPHQDVAMAQRYGTYGGVVLQEQPCRVDELEHEVRDFSVNQDTAGNLHLHHFG